jgi:hypothetical protein
MLCLVLRFICFSSLGQNLITSTDISENLFTVFVSASGLVLFALLIGNVQVLYFYGIFLFVHYWIEL